MCTMIGTSIRVTGAVRSGGDWSPVGEVAVTLDHATRVWAEHALRLDLSERGARSPSASLELDLPSAKALLAEIGAAVAAAERAGVG